MDQFCTFSLEPSKIDPKTVSKVADCTYLKYLTFNLFVKGTVSVISSDHPCQDSRETLYWSIM